MSTTRWADRRRCRWTADGDEIVDTTTTYTYDHRGLHISETTGSETKEYLFDTRNPTGYAQVTSNNTSTTC